ncbi:MAG: ABC-2 family transporter protein [Verrucomicrobia bacterium]|nr:ABC-2 family transporter protein [Verrucomicrobiota bacterium]
MLYWKLIRVAIRSQMQYPASFLMLTVSHFFGTLVDILAIWVLFDRFQMIQGWTLPEVGLIYGMVHMGFAISEITGRSFDTFYLIVKQGDFDRFLLKPISLLLQIAAREVHLARLGRFFQGFLVLLWSAHALSFSLFSLHALVILLSILGIASLFYGLLVLHAAISFWTIESLEVLNITTFGGLQVGQYPMSIYPKGFRLIFTLLIPLACVGYYPIAILLRHETLPFWLSFITPLVGFLFLFISCQFWHLGVRHYRSTGS